jgi:hypothetical protein
MRTKYFTDWSLGVEWRMEEHEVVYRVESWGRVSNGRASCTL